MLLIKVWQVNCQYDDTVFFTIGHAAQKTAQKHNTCSVEIVNFSRRIMLKNQTYEILGL